MEYFHVDVFSSHPFGGNGLTVVFVDELIAKDTMLKITQEFRQFETIFLRQAVDTIFDGFVFTVEEELPFAGHPILGAAACIHAKYFPESNIKEIKIQLRDKLVTVLSTKTDFGYSEIMNQGEPEYLRTVSDQNYHKICSALNLRLEDLYPNLPLEVISTGLPYLLIPLSTGIEKVKITVRGFEEILTSLDAKFVYVFDVERLICRTWDNQGVVEDIATGSAAGPLGAYLVKYGIKQLNSEFEIYQGEFVGRSSSITVEVTSNEGGQEVKIKGEVSFFASGQILNQDQL